MSSTGAEPANKKSADSTDELKVVGGRLREARESLGLTQEDVSGALGIQRTSVHSMEAGKRNVTAVELRRLARLYRRSVEWLLGEETTAASNVALHRATDALSDDDKEQVLRFAQFLASGSSREHRAVPGGSSDPSGEAKP